MIHTFHSSAFIWKILKKNIQRFTKRGVSSRRSSWWKMKEISLKHHSWDRGLALLSVNVNLFSHGILPPASFSPPHKYTNLLKHGALCSGGGEVCSAVQSRAEQSSAEQTGIGKAWKMDSFCWMIHVWTCGEICCLVATAEDLACYS